MHPDASKDIETMFPPHLHPLDTCKPLWMCLNPLLFYFIVIIIFFYCSCEAIM